MNFKNENWKKIDGFENYQVSNMGRVRSLDHWEEYTRVIKSGKEVHHKKFFNGRVLTPSQDSNGYLHVRLAVHGKYSLKKVHRLVYETFIGNIPENMTVDHIDSVKTNNKVNNLRLLTRKQNIDIFRSTKVSHKYIDNKGQQFCSFKRYCKRNNLIWNKYFFIKSLRTKSNYMNTNLIFKEI